MTDNSDRAPPSGEDNGRTARPGTPDAVGAGAVSRGRRGLDPRTQNALGGFFVGLTIFLLVAWFLHQIGFIYIHTQPQGFKQLKAVNEAMLKARPALEDGIVALRIVEDRVKTAISDKENLSETRKFVNATTIFPEIEEKISPLLPQVGSIIVKTAPNGAYKILIHSEICVAAALEQPQMVDPRLDYYGLFCRHFGVWNEKGRNL
jgi:hypothetical protein